MRAYVMVYRGSVADFRDWLDDWARTESMTRHPAGKKIGR